MQRRNEMKIEDYCAQKAYDVYRENYLKDNKDNLSDIEKLNYQRQEDFVPNFAQDLRKHILTFLDDYATTDRDAVRSGLTKILKSKFDDLKGNHIVDTTGKIDIQLMKSDLSKSVEKDLSIHPKLTSQEISETVSQNNISNKEKVDFSNPKAKAEYFENIFTEYRSLETEEEKEQFKRNHFHDYDKNKETIDLGCECEIEKLKIKEDNINISDEECQKQMCKTMSEKTGKSEDEIDIIDKLTRNASILTELYEQLKVSPNSQDIEAEIKKIETENMQLNQQLEQEKNNSQNISDLENILDLNTDTEQNETDDLEDILNADFQEESLDEFSILLDAESEFQSDEQIKTSTYSSNDILIPNELKDNGKNSILTGTDEKDFADIGENLPAIINQNIFSKIKQTLSNIPQKIIKAKENFLNFINDKLNKPQKLNSGNNNDQKYNKTSISSTLQHIDGIEIKTNPNTNKSLLEAKTEKSEITVSEITTDRN